MRHRMIIMLWGGLLLAQPMFSQEVKTERLDSVKTAVLPQGEDAVSPVAVDFVDEPFLPDAENYSSFGFDPCKNYSLDEKYGAEGTIPVLTISPNALPNYVPPAGMVLPSLAACHLNDEVTGVMDRQTALVMYRANTGSLSLMPYARYDMVNAGFMGHYTKVGFGGRMAYQVNDWLTVGMFGQFVPKNAQSIMVTPFDPKSGYGGFVEVMFNERWGVGCQVSRDYVLQRNGKWKWQTGGMFYPIHRKK